MRDRYAAALHASVSDPSNTDAQYCVDISRIEPRGSVRQSYDGQHAARLEH
jgi:hypothetical protein